MAEQGMSEHLQQFWAEARVGVRPLLPKRFRGDIPVVPVVQLSGVIGFSTPLKPGLTLAGVARQLDRAFGMSNARAVALVINSPGGSPAQSHLIYRRIRAARRREEASGDRVHGGCRGVRRLHDRLRGRRDHLQPFFDHRLDRRGRRLVWIRQG